MKGMMYNFRSLPIGVIYTAQERQIDGSFTEEDEDVEEAEIQYVSDLPAGVRSAVNGIVDIIGRLYTVPVEIDGKTKIVRRLWLAPSSVYDTGYRSDYELPSYLKNPTVPRLIRAVRTGDPNPSTKKKGG